MASFGRRFLLPLLHFPRWMGTLGMILALSPLAGAQPIPSPATPPPSPERFRLLYGGQPAGEETFRIEPAGEAGRLRVSARSDLHLMGRPIAMEQELEIDAASSGLRSYELGVRTGEERQSVRARRAGDSLSVEAESASGRFHRTTAEEGEVLILDNLLVNHLALLVRQLAAQLFESRSLRVVVPQVGAVLTVEVSTDPPAPDGTRTVRLNAAGVVEVLTVDAQGSLLRAEVPSQGVVYERVSERASAEEPSERAGETPVAPPPPARSETAPPREQISTPTRRLFEERVVTFVAGDITLSGLLMLPRGGQPIPYPAVLLVHGSGPLDRDESIGPNHPFLDLAKGLAVMGIASFRYDKRTLAAPRTIDPVRVTVEEEVIADALAALEAMRSEAEIDGRSIAIVGHSLGGGLAATIARRDRRVAGIVVLAGSPRPLDELIRDQLRFLGSAEAIDPTLRQLDSLRAGTLPAERLVLGMSGHYLSDYRARDLAGEFVAFRGPVLFLQGGKDYQVTRTDFDLWREKMEAGGKRNATFHFFPGLGHLFIPIPGEPSAAALLAPGTVDPAVIEEIARFAAELD